MQTPQEYAANLLKTLDAGTSVYLVETNRSELIAFPGVDENYYNAVIETLKAAE